ncbi:MAG: hypothetical protein ACK4Y7_04910 [Caldimicrobium sp.]
MRLIRTRSGRFLNIDHIIALSIEETKIEIEGKKRVVYKVVAYMSYPLLPAVLGIYFNEDKARDTLENIVEQIIQEKKLIVVESEC